MRTDKPMTLLLIEDDTDECDKFKDCANRRADIIFVGMTNSGTEGINYVRTRLPEGIILDLELNKGEGSGLQFLSDLKTIELAVRPIIIVTTNCSPGLVYDRVHSNGADFVFHKCKPDYSPDIVLEHMLILRNPMYAANGNELLNVRQSLVESRKERQAHISRQIDKELLLIGISPKHKGRKHLYKAIQYLLNLNEGDSESVIQKIAIENKVNYNAISRAMQTAINNAWKNSPAEDLLAHYNAIISIKTGVPTPTEFIYYYADKIRQSM